MESSSTTLRSNIEQFRQYASLYERKDILSFLDFCQDKIVSLLRESGGESGHPGGMVKKKIKWLTHEHRNQEEVGGRGSVLLFSRQIRQFRKDVVRALVELITNSNDSYNRMEDAGLATTGSIIIEVQRKHANSVLRVCDNAE